MPLEPAVPAEPAQSIDSAGLTTIAANGGKSPSASVLSSLSARRVLLYLFLFLAQLSFFAFLALHRLIDSDEGFYLYLSKLAATQKTILYRDVFYQQMPLLPYLYGLWMRVFGFTWESGRIFSAVITASTGLLVFDSVLRATKRLTLASVALLLYALNLSVLLFFLTAKTYALSTAFLFVAMLLAASFEGRFNRFLSGLFFALSIETRLFFVAAAPAFVYILATGKGVKRAEAVRDFIFGSAFGLIPSFLFFLIAPRQFVFDNLLYHGLRDPAGLVGDLGQKLRVARNLLFGLNSAHPTQFSVLLLGLPLVLFSWKKLGAAGKLSALLAIMLISVSFLPTPTFGQYFCVAVPFLVLCLMCGIADGIELLPAGNRRFLQLYIVVLLVLSAVAAVPRLNSLFVRGQGIPGVPAGSQNDWTIAAIKRISADINSMGGGDALILTTWPGYLLDTDRKAYPKMENQISLGVGCKMNPEDAAFYKMLRLEDIPEAIRDERAATVVIGNCREWWGDGYFQALEDNGYKVYAEEGSTRIYARTTATP